MDNSKDEAIKWNSEEKFEPFLSDDDEIRLMRNTLIELGRQDGTKELAVKMVKNYIKNVSELTGLTVDEIDEIYRYQIICEKNKARQAEINE